MEYPVYSYQSTMYNFIPFLVNYEFLSDTLIDASAAVEDFNGVFEKGLMRLVGNCGNIELPTLKNLYEEVVLLIKDSFTKTSHIQTALAKVSSSISTCVIKLHQTYKEHLEEIGKRADELQKVKRDIEQTQVKISHINERVLLLTEAETVDKFYKLNYKEPYYPLHSKAITQLQNQIAIQHSMMEYYEENMEYEGVKNKKLCGILSNELEEAMINTTFVEVSAGRKEEGKGRSSYQPRVSATVEEACIRVERGKFPEGEELLVKVKAMKEEVDNLLDRLEYE